jgi:hypothetical protein
LRGGDGPGELDAEQETEHVAVILVRRTGRGSGLDERMIRRLDGAAVAERADQVTEWSVLDGGWTAT